MNELLKDLKEQALVWAIETLDPDELNDNEWGVAIDQKFAQLIVRECAELSVSSQYANTKSEYYEGFNEALIYAGNKIKKHFGVEE